MEDLAVAVTIDFELRGRTGRVVVHYGVNDVPARWGYSHLGLDSLVGVSRGFPVVHAEVDYPAKGYGAVLAWIQVIDSTNLDSGENRKYIDMAPQLEGLALPYYGFGIRPVLFDAPSTTARNMAWHANALLVVSPDCVISRRLRALCGFSWGYRVTDGKPQPVPAVIIQNPSTLSEEIEFLRAQHPSWIFENG
jgi:hypothetical protein